MMQKRSAYRFLIGLLLTFFLLNIFAPQATAAGGCEEGVYFSTVQSNPSVPITYGGKQDADITAPSSLSFTFKNVISPGTYHLELWGYNEDSPLPAGLITSSSQATLAGNTDHTFTLSPPKLTEYYWQYNFDLVYTPSGGAPQRCQFTSVAFSPVYKCSNFRIWTERRLDDGSDNMCYYNPTSGCIGVGETLYHSYSVEKDGTAYNGETGLWTGRLGFDLIPSPNQFANPGAITAYIAARGAADSSNVKLDPATCTNINFTISPGCSNTANQCASEVSLIPPDDAEKNDVNFDLCSQASGEQKTTCELCLAKGGIDTAVGCIETKPQSIIKAIVQIGVGIAGGIALLMTLVGGFLLTTSQGDPKRTQEGKDMITASVIGIIFVLFSVVILQFIGVTIFRLPGFGT